MIQFPPSALEYLRRHAKDYEAHPEHTKANQLLRTQKRWESIQHWVRAAKPRSVLDIGCGLGMIDIWFANYGGVQDVHLMDGDGTEPIRGDYADDMLPWNSVDVAVEMVRANVQPGVGVAGWLADTRHHIPVDMIVSFKSWGTHYPVNTYIDLAKRSLSKIGGVLMIDILHDNEGKAQLQAAGFTLRQMIGRRLHVFTI